MQSNFIEQRRKLLEIFLIKICEINFLYISEEFQMFLRGPEDFLKSLAGIKRRNLSEIGLKYQELFFLHNMEDLDINMISESEVYLKFTLEKLESFENSCKINVANYENYINNWNNTLNGIQGINESYKRYGKDFSPVSTKIQCQNPFVILLE